MIAMPVVQARIVEAADDRLTLGHAKAAVGDRHRQRVGARAHLLAAGAVARHGDQRWCAYLDAQLAAAAAAGPGKVPDLHDFLSSYHCKNPRLFVRRDAIQSDRKTSA